VVYCPDFPTNLVSLRLLEAQGVDWSHRSGQLMLHGDSDILGFTRRIHNQYIIEHNETQESMQSYSALATTTPAPN